MYRLKLRLLTLILFIKHSKYVDTFDDAYDCRKRLKKIADGYLHAK